MDYRDDEITLGQLKAVLAERLTKPCGLYADKVLRPMTPPIILFCIRRGWAADFVTLIHILTGIAAGALVLAGKPWALILAIPVWQFWFLTDLVDGEVARYRRTISVTGIYWDVISHYLIFPWLFVCYGLTHYLQTGQAWPAFAGFWAGLCVMIKRAGQDAIQATAAIQLARDKKSLYAVEAGAMPAEAEGAAPSVPALTPGALFHVFNNYPAIMNVFCLISLLVVIRPEWFWSANRALLYVYAITLTVVTARNLQAAIAARKPDQLYRSLRRP